MWIKQHSLPVKQVAEGLHNTIILYLPLLGGARS